MEKGHRLRCRARLDESWQGGVGAILVLLLAVGGCSESRRWSVADAGPLWVDPQAQDFSENPELLERILASPHGYLRFINLEFSAETCRLFEDTFDEVPIFNLHGDAHVEQYAVTDLGRGLTDFDDSSTGPAIVDLMRLAVSLRLAAAANGWEEQADDIIYRLLEGYSMALVDPEVEAPLPQVVRRLSAEFDFDRNKYFEWVESIVQPVPEAEAEALVEAMQPYVEAMIVEHPEVGPGYFDVVGVGYLRLGIGSALDRKYLVRVQGNSPDPGDDLVLELKQVRDLTGIDCISVARRIDPQRILRGQARIAYQPYRFLGYVRFDGLTFWIHAWVDNYVESSVETTFQSPLELAEVAFDIGVQLGRGHPKLTESQLDFQLRNEQLTALERDQERIIEVSKILTAEVVRAWEEFRSALA